jgi:hypothetical protein
MFGVQAFEAPAHPGGFLAYLQLKEQGPCYVLRQQPGA